MSQFKAPAAAPAAPAAPAAAAPAVAGEQVTSPMPGTIVKVNVKAGHAVKAGEELAVLRGAEALEIRIKTRTASSADTDADAGGRMQERNSEPVQYFHRAPRILPVIYDEAIKIEAVPEPEEEETQSALQAVTQSVAMVIPMMLASLMMVTASRRSGYGSSIMMYTGLVMAITSGSMAAVMALVNIRRQKKRHKEKEDRRFEAYSNYLIGKTEEIREKYTHNTEAMREIWPDARTLISRRGEKTGLWNRNQEHDDFLKVRIGTGDVPFQVKIDVPEERFNILEDELRDKPRYIRDNFKTLYDVPILLDLKKHPLIGIVGGDQKKGAVELAHVICAQLAMTHCYTDVRMICFYDRDSSASGILQDGSRTAFPKTGNSVWSPRIRSRFRISAMNFPTSSGSGRTRVRTRRRKKKAKQNCRIMFCSSRILR